MIEIRLHGRGGQGAVKAAEILAKAAFYDGKIVQSFPFFGVERRGAPVQAFTRISDDPIRVHSYIYEPDVLIVLDPTLVGAEGIDIIEGIKDNGKIVINSTKDPSDFEFHNKNGVQVYTVDATAIALKFHLGSASAPIVNTAIVGAIAKVTGLVSIDAVKKAIIDTIPRYKEENAAAAEDTFNNVK
ncbi:2-oxoacid:acceptor oxidoreductase family protein [bacterium]|nr:2-oxoacid:acceptor oxidoreductase family protein [bacterium]